MPDAEGVGDGTPTLLWTPREGSERSTHADEHPGDPCGEVWRQVPMLLSQKNPGVGTEIEEQFRIKEGAQPHGSVAAFVIIHVCPPPPAHEEAQPFVGVPVNPTQQGCPQRHRE